MRNDVLKRKYIQASFEIVCQEGRKGVTIRRLAKDLNCNMASLYRCFQDLDELFLYTGLKFVEGYLLDVRRLLDKQIDNLELFFQIWECFINHSLKNPKMYNSIFFGTYSSKLDYATDEYYTRLFPEEMVSFDEETKRILMKGSFQTGDSLISKTLMRCVEDGIIREEDRLYLDTLLLQIYKGYLKDFIDKRRDEEMIEQSKEELLNYFRSIVLDYKI